MSKKKRSRLRSERGGASSGWGWTLLLLTAATLCLHLMCLFLGTWYFTVYRLVSYFSEPEIFLLNLIPVVLLVLFFYLLTNRAWAGFLIPAVLLLIICIANYYTVLLRGEPFVAEDILNTRDGVGILKEYDLQIPLALILSLAAVIGGTVILALFARGKFPKKRRWLRLVLLVLTAVLCGFCWKGIYSDTNHYDQLLLTNADRFNVWKNAENYASKGLVYSFLHSVDTMLPEKPDGYSEGRRRKFLRTFPMRISRRKSACI